MVGGLPEGWDQEAIMVHLALMGPLDLTAPLLALMVLQAPLVL